MKAKDFNYYKGIQYKGFTVIKKDKTYIASAYANPEFNDTNLNRLKKQINRYLRGENIILETINNRYEIVNFKRKDGLYNTYVQRIGKLNNTYKGEAVYTIGCSTKSFPVLSEVKELKYEI